MQSCSSWILSHWRPMEAQSDLFSCLHAPGVSLSSIPNHNVVEHVRSQLSHMPCRFLSTNRRGREMIIIYLNYFLSSLLKLHYRNHFSVLVVHPSFLFSVPSYYFFFLSDSRKSTQKLHWLIQKLHLRKLTLEKS